MKIYSTSRYLFSALLLLTTLLSCCRQEETCPDEEPSKHTEYKLNTDETNKIPYRKDGLDTLIYVSNAGDTAKLYGQGVQNFMVEEAVNRTNNPGCPFYDFNYYEHIVYEFKSTNAEFSNLLYYLSRSSLSSSKLNLNSMDIKISKLYAYRKLISAANYDFGYTDSVSINGVLYNGTKIFHVDENNNSFLLYNYKYGILSISNVNGKIWLKQF